MGRSVNPRFGNYSNDAGVLLRIIKAVEVDNMVTDEWRADALRHLRAALQALLAPRIR